MYSQIYNQLNEIFSKYEFFTYNNFASLLYH